MDEILRPSLRLPHSCSAGRDPGGAPLPTPLCSHPRHSPCLMADTDDPKKLTFAGHPQPVTHARMKHAWAAAGDGGVRGACVCGGAGGHPLHAGGERGAERYRDSDRAAQSPRPGRRLRRHQRAQGNARQTRHCQLCMVLELPRNYLSNLLNNGKSI